MMVARPVENVLEFSYTPYRAAGIPFGVKEWVNPYDTMGYSLATYLLEPIICNYLLAEKIITLSGGMLSIISLYYLICALTEKPLIALTGALCLALNSVFTHFTFAENADLPALGFATLAIWLLIYFIKQNKPSHWGIILAGMFLGLSYLFSYLSLSILFACLLWIIILLFNSLKKVLYTTGALLLGFIAGGAMQLYTNNFALGNPLANRLCNEAWRTFHSSGSNNESLPIGLSSVYEVFSKDTTRVVGQYLTHWATLFDTQYLDTPVWVLVITGIPFLLYGVGKGTMYNTQNSATLLVALAFVFYSSYALLLNIDPYKLRTLLFALVMGIALGGAILHRLSEYILERQHSGTMKQVVIVWICVVLVSDTTRRLIKREGMRFIDPMDTRFTAP
jgi:4-amino-4-deoxy-L-arabinose transferase-like glycosyltransferase